jgi:regulator of sigma E protease
MSSFIIGVSGIIFLFFAAVLIHEFGHFIFAKMFGVRVERFSIGMGKIIWAKTWGDTEYCLSLLPIGGYVKLTGPISQEVIAYEELLQARDYMERLRKKVDKADADQKAELEKELAEAEKKAAQAKAAYEEHGGKEAAEKVLPGITSLKPDDAETANWLMEDNIALRSKPFYAKFLIFVAGCAMNMLLAWFVITMMFAGGYTIDVPKTLHVERPEAESPLSEFDIRDRDLVTAVNGDSVETWEDFQVKLSELHEQKKSARVELQREGTEQPVVLDIPFQSLENKTGVILEDADELSLKLAEGYLGSAYLYFSPHAPVYIDQVIPNHPAERGGLQDGDKIVAINGTPVETWTPLVRVIKSSAKKELSIKAERTETAADGTTATTLVNAQVTPNDGGQIGIIRSYNNTQFKKVPLTEAMVSGFWGLIAQTQAIVGGFQKLFTGQLSNPLQQLGGPVAIAATTYKHANRGIQDYFELFVSINIILAIMNLLPIPLLDGGHILFSLIETIIRRPIPARPLLFVYQLSLYLLMGLAVFLIGNDIWQHTWSIRSGGSSAQVIERRVEPQTGVVESNASKESTDAPEATEADSAEIGSTESVETDVNSNTESPGAEPDPVPNG